MAEWLKAIPAECLRESLILFALLVTPLYGWHRRLLGAEISGRTKAEEKLENAKRDQIEGLKSEIDRLRNTRRD